MTRARLSSPVTELSHIGKGVAAQLRRLKVLTVQDLLFYFPARYDDLSRITLIKDARLGERIVARVRVELIENRRSKWRRTLLTQAMVSDKTGSLRVTWFNQPWIAKMFKPGDELYLVGELKDDGAGAYFSSPIYERVSRGAATHTARIVPVYPSTERLSQKQIRFLIKCALPLTYGVSESLPLKIQKEYELMGIVQALQYIHFPPKMDLLESARYRFKFEELFRLQLFALSLKRELKRLPAPRVVFNESTTKDFVAGLSFELTEDQRRAAWEILGDLTGRSEVSGVRDQVSGLKPKTWNLKPQFPHPMNRLLEGEVGSGKTIVVAIAALNVVLGGGQVALMAPTGILARQHFGTFARLFASHGVRIGLLTQGAGCVYEVGITNHELGRREMIKMARGGEIDVMVGTQALIQEGVQFKNLVLAVVDEQHRFGVQQRAALKEKRGDGLMPHLLSLTATPIPRSLALVFYGDLDISVLREMPKGRHRIETVLVAETPSPQPSPPKGGEGVLKKSPLPKGEGGRRPGEGATWSREQAYEFVRAQVDVGHQVFWTCPIIDPSDTLGVKAATEVFAHLKNEVFADLRIGLLHGRMKSKEREKMMEEFVGISGDRVPEASETRSPRIDILVATPVIEVGIDVPNATVMVIEGAERFGLAQLHQFRGRVGRGEARSHCLLIVEDGQEANDRLKAFLECDNGFELAERDLALRGPGEIYSGTEQSGFPEFKIASLSDVEIAKAAKAAARKLLDQDPELTAHSILKDTIRVKVGKAHLE